MSDLLYLDFDHSEDDEGTNTWDALAYVQSNRANALLDEITALLKWAHDTMPLPPGPVDDGHQWDYDLQWERDNTMVSCRYDVRAGSIAPRPQVNAGEALAMNLSLCGQEAFGQALRATYLRD